MENLDMGLQHSFKSSDGYELYKQVESSKAKNLKDQLVREAENKAISYLSGQYGSAKLDRESKVELTARKGSQDNLVYDGTVTVFTTISAGAAAKKLSLTARVNHSTVSLPKLKFVAKLVADTQTEGELREVLASEQVVKADKSTLVDLGAFRIVSSGEKVLEVMHPIYGEVALGRLSEAELAESDKNPLVSVGAKGTFSKDHNQKVLAGKAFEVLDSDGDMVQLTVNNIKGWLHRNEIQLDSKVQVSAPVKATFSLGDQVLITAALGEYYGDTIEAKDVVNKQATVARIASDNLILSVEGIAEDVVLPLNQANVLQHIVNMATPKKQVSLEAILRDMVVDRFPSTSIKFVGKFKASELKTTEIPVQASIEKVASTENKEMEPQDLALKFKQTSGFDQFMAGEMSKVASKKRSLEEKVSSELINTLNKSYSPTRFISMSSALDYVYEKGHTGKVSIQAEVQDSKGLKRITVDVPLSDDIYALPKAADLDKIIADTVSEQEKFNISAAKEASKKCAAIDAEMEFNEQSVQAALGPKPQSKPKVEKAAGVGSNQPQEATIQPVFKLNKHFLPASLQVGDAIDLSGIRYKLTSKGGDALSKGTDDGNCWTFERLQSNSDAPAVYRDNN